MKNIENITDELCPYCETEVEIASNKPSPCPECGKEILPCSMCSGCSYGEGGEYCPEFPEYKQKHPKVAEIEAGSLAFRDALVNLMKVADEYDKFLEDNFEAFGDEDGLMKELKDSKILNEINGLLMELSDMFI